MPVIHATSRAVPSHSLLGRLPKWLLCIPLVLHWFWLAAWYRSLTLPSCANPGIPTGGLAGEGKLGCLQAIPAGFAHLVAPTVAVRCAPDRVAMAEALRKQSGLAFPLVAKPDVGWCGYGVRRVNDAAALAEYARVFPRGHTFILQPLAPGPMEAGLMYRRDPGGAGAVVSVILRHGPAVVGDGIRSQAQLITADTRLRRLKLPQSAAVPRAGEVVPLTTVNSLRAGGRYQDAPWLITSALTAQVDGMARGMGAHAVRFDVRFASPAALRAGGFTVIEVNGAGAEWIAAWDPALSLIAALRLVFANHRGLFALGAAMRARGHRPCGAITLSRAWLSQQRLARRLPSSN